MDAYQIIKVILGIIYAALCCWTLVIVDRAYKRDRNTEIKTRREASTKSCESWSELYDYAMNKATEELLKTKREHANEVKLLNEQIKALNERCEHYEQELSRMNIINGKLWDRKRDDRDE